MAKDADAMLASLAQDRSEAEYRTPALRLLDDRLLAFEALGDDLPEEERGILDRMREEIAALEASENPPYRLPFIFIKMRRHDREKAQMFFEKEKQARLNRRMKEDGEDRRETLLLSIENDRMLTQGYKQDPEMAIKKSLVDAILELEGKTEQWAAHVPDDHPEMALSEGQEERISLTDDLPMDEYFRRLEIAEKKRLEWLDTKRENIAEAQMDEVCARRAELMAHSNEDLVRSIVLHEMEHDALVHATARLRDYSIWITARSPHDPIEQMKGTRRRMTYRHMFETVDHVTDLREGSEEEQDLWAWLSETFDALQVVQTSGDIGRVARSDAFPEDLQFLP